VWRFRGFEPLDGGSDLSRATSCWFEWKHMMRVVEGLYLSVELSRFLVGIVFNLVASL
jgi:hypothetical protein